MSNPYTRNFEGFFTNLSSSPKVSFNFESNINELANDIHELTLTFNVKAEVDDKTLYLVELKQCGVFLLSTDNEGLKKKIPQYPLL